MAGAAPPDLTRRAERALASADGLRRARHVLAEDEIALAARLRNTPPGGESRSASTLLRLITWSYCAPAASLQ